MTASTFSAPLDPPTGTRIFDPTTAWVCEASSSSTQGSNGTQPDSTRYPNLTEELQRLRRLRHTRYPGAVFDPTVFVEEKLELLEQFFYRNGLDAVTFGLSGGVDSAVVALLMSRLVCLKVVRALVLPIFTDSGVTGQVDAVQRAHTLAEMGGFEVHTWDLSGAFAALQETHGQPTSPWADGQAASVLRTPALYYQAALLQHQGYRSIVVGTTNRDEGAYLGFFGKASDGMVDLQPIADLHKNEVYAVARHLGVPDCILQEPPRGDVWDGKTDEQMVGAPYWYVELYQLRKCFPGAPRVHLTPSEETDSTRWSEAVRLLHQQNAHKYEVGNPAHFVDVLPRGVPGGWK